MNIITDLKLKRKENVKMTVIWDVTTSGLMEFYQVSYQILHGALKVHQISAYKILRNKYLI
jgi:hypothetical protein